MKPEHIATIREALEARRQDLIDLIACDILVKGHKQDVVENLAAIDAALAALDEQPTPLDMPDGKGQSWINSVKDLIENASLARAGQSVTRLAIYALKTQHDKQFGREVKGCMLMYLERCSREVNRRAPAIPPDVRETIRGLLESGIEGTKSTIRTRNYHGLRAFVTTEEEWLSRYEAALSWLDAQGGGRNG